MLWELEQLELQADELEREIGLLRKAKTLSRKDSARLAELETKSTQCYVKRQALISAISRDAHLSKQLDARRAAQAKPVSQATPPAGASPEGAERLSMRARLNAWRQNRSREATQQAGLQHDNEPSSELE